MAGSSATIATTTTRTAAAAALAVVFLLGRHVATVTADVQLSVGDVQGDGDVDIFFSSDVTIKEFEVV